MSYRAPKEKVGDDPRDLAADPPTLRC